MIKNRINKKYISGIMLIILLISISFPIFFIAAHEHHHHNCSDKDCPICLTFENCEKMLYELGTGTGIRTNGTLFVILIISAVLMTVRMGVYDTPVLLKVRLNN